MSLVRLCLELRLYIRFVVAFRCPQTGFSVSLTKKIHRGVLFPNRPPRKPRRRPPRSRASTGRRLLATAWNVRFCKPICNAFQSLANNNCPMRAINGRLWTSREEEHVMAEHLKIIITSFGRGVSTFIRPWTRTYEPPPRDPRGIGRYFAHVGKHLTHACETYAERHPEIPVHA